jgi:hypothetical protein
MAYAYFHKTSGEFQFVLTEAVDFEWNDRFEVSDANPGDRFAWVDRQLTKVFTLREEDRVAGELALAEHRRTEYQRQRASEYPPIGDQLDAIWKGGDAAAEMVAKVQAVKSKYPKGETV